MSGFKVSDFVHLHNHTHYSLLDGLQKIEPMLDKVKEYGMGAVAMTDHGTLSGVIEFYKKSTEKGIKPIIGMETYVASRLHTDKEVSKDKANYHLILLAMNNIGYQNLMKLSTIASLHGFYHKPRIDHQLLEQYNEGIIVLSGCAGGEIGDAFRNQQDNKAKSIALWYKKIFGDRYYLEIQDHGHNWQVQKDINDKVLQLGNKLNIPVVVTADAHYLNASDKDAHELLLCVQTGSFLSDDSRMSLKDFDLHLTDPKEIFSRWEKHPEVIQNTQEIAKRCQVEISLGNMKIPKYELPKGVVDYDFLEEKVCHGLIHQYAKDKKQKSVKKIKDLKGIVNSEVITRAEYEMNVINKMGYSSYFLIVADFVAWGKSQGIVFGPGRGSAAGSIVAYCLNITALDPLKYDLLFERFLNPDRISMPDIDIDIQDNRRDEVIQYCVDKYGQEKVAHIVTFGTMAARNAIRDTARVLEVPYAEADRLAKMVPPPVQGRHIPLKKSIKDSKELKQEYKENENAKRIIDLAIKLEGTIRSHGVHAAGVVIAPDDIVNYTPLEMAQKGVVATQYSMGPIEDLGLVKMDFLGLSNLTIIKNTLRIIKKVWGEDIELSEIPLDDQKTYELLSKGDTTGVFQLESSGMKRYLKELKPTRFEDIIAMVSLYRPGPLTAGLTDKFIARKNGLEKIKYDHILMEPALEATYGVLVYQEQVMQIAKDMSSFSGGEADTLRKAVGKKIRSMMAQMQNKIVDGAMKNGVDRKIAEKFWKDVEGFADYAFNKSHAACYALIAYHTAYLKANYPEAFMAALMTSNCDDTDKLAYDISECRRMGIEVLPPNINESYVEFAVTPDSKQIRFGMSAIKNVGVGAVESILSVRSGQRFATIEEFIKRINPGVINKKVWESLIKAGALDEYKSRYTMLANLDGIIAYASKVHKENKSNQADLFGELKGASVTSSLIFDKTGSELPKNTYLTWERELLGIYLSEHPLESYKAYFSENLVPIERLKSLRDGKKVTVGGLIQTAKEINTKNGQKMAFVTIEDLSSSIEIIIFPSIYKEFKDNLAQDTIIKVSGKLNTKDKDGHQTGEPKILVDNIEIISEETIAGYKPTGKNLSLTTQKIVHSQPVTDTEERLFIYIKDVNDHNKLVSIKRIASQHVGNTETVMVIENDDGKHAIKLPFKCDTSSGLIGELSEILGEDCVVLK